MAALEQVLEEVNIVELASYASREEDAKRRLVNHDIQYWPTAAVALVLNCAGWTEDTDFFGTGIATWTTDRVEIFLHSLVQSS